MTGFTNRAYAGNVVDSVDANSTELAGVRLAFVDVAVTEISEETWVAGACV